MSDAFDKLKTREQSVIHQTYGRYPLAVQSARGARLYDLDGREYVDLLAGLAVANIGHSHPAVLEAVEKQFKKLVHVSNLFYQEEHVALAERLLATTHMADAGKVFFCNSGAEANEAAIKLARRYMQTVKNTEAFEIVSLEGSFHGRTLATVSATGQPALQQGFDPLPAGFVHVPKEDPAALREAVSEKTAAVLIEVVQGEGGVNPLSGEYLQGLATFCKENGVLLIIDEIQTGMGRTGKMWAHEHHGLKPDIFTSAKALAGGLPMGAMFSTDEVAQGFAPGVHASTFGGGGVIAAAAQATLDVLRKEGLVERAETMGAYARKRFEALAEKMPEMIAEVRGIGLMIGIELADPAHGGPNAANVWKKLLGAGYVCNLAQGKVLRLLPPLCIEERDLDGFADALAKILQDT
jgi:acetylornithine aminotransferase